MAEEKKRDPRTVQLKRVRLSFTDPLLDKQAAVAGGRESHNCTLIVQMEGGEGADPKAVSYAAENQAKIISALRAAGEAFNGKPELFRTVAEDAPKRVAYRKGERFKSADGDVYKGYTGNWAISAAGPGGGKHRPKIFDRYRKELSEDEIRKNFDSILYSGCFADVFVSFYATAEGGLGVFGSIDAIRSLQEGDRLAGGGYRASSDDWDEEDDDDTSGGFGDEPAGSKSSESDFG